MIPLKAEGPAFIVKGYVYINDVRTEPDEVHLMLEEELRIADTYDDGHYVIIFTNAEPGETGEFFIIENDIYYIPEEETVTIQEGVFLYNIDLHIEIKNNQDTNPDDNQDNIPPVADAGGPYFEIINNQIEFDGSKSFDTDGTINSYNWDFGDNNTGSGIKTSHTYHQIGKYQIKLSVRDNEGLTDISYTYAQITATPNIPPTNLTMTGPINGTTLTNYEYSLQAIDSDNDSLQYTIDWDDGTQTNSDFVQNGTIFTINHSYNEPGIFNIIALAMDENNVYSEIVELKMLIDATYCENIGYMVDYTNDGVYDLFHANTTGIETPVEKNNGFYLIDIDNDGTYNYRYNPATYELLEYTIQDSSDQRTTQTSFTLILSPEIILALAVLVIVVVLISIILIVKKQKPKKEKMYYVKEKRKEEIEKTDEEIIESEEELKNIKEIEKRIDRILSKEK